MRGGKRKGAGRPKSGQKIVERTFSLSPGVFKIMEQIPWSSRSNYVNRAIAAQYRKGLGAKLTPIQFAAEILDINPTVLKKLLQFHGQNVDNSVEPPQDTEAWSKHEPFRP